ncbi:MAG: prolyl oligopeptidase family serine peptidase [Caldimonas sp.]
MAAFLLAVASVLTCRFATAADAPIPIQAFFANDQIADVELSPSGRRMALIATNKSGRRVLAVMDVDAPKPPVVVADSLDVDISEFWWLNDDRLVYSVVNLKEGGSEQSVGGLFTVKPDGSEPRTVYFSGRVSILSVPRNGGDTIVLGRYQFDGVRDLVAVHPERLTLPGNHQRPLLPPGYPSHTKRWTFDRSGNARAVQTSFEGVVEVFYREPGKDTWVSIGKWPELEAPWYPHSVDETGHLYVVVTPPASTSYLARFDFGTGKPESAPLVATPGFDFDGRLLFEDDGERLLGVRVDTDAETTVWLDPARKKLQDIADARFPGLINRTMCSRCGAGGAMLVYSYSDRDPGSYSLYRPETSAWTTIGRRRPAIDPRQMAALDLHRIKARDGLDLPVWVTTPRGPPDTARPAVVLVHGGPWLRGTHWRWDSEAQFLASRGYVVIEPEFRGGRGFGQRHLTSGFRQWGTTMQDDVADAVRFAIDKGWVDGKRVCIAGGSYGGYATLMGTIRYPELYRCGAAWMAVTDPQLMFEDLWVSDIGQESKQYSMTAMIGDPVKDAAMLRAASPVERAAEIKVPILMAFGIQDRRVPIVHGKRMRAAMRAAGQDPEYILYDGEGHGWFKVENRIDFWTHVEKFLDKNLH